MGNAMHDGSFKPQCRVRKGFEYARNLEIVGAIVTTLFPFHTITIAVYVLHMSAPQVLPTDPLQADGMCTFSQSHTGMGFNGHSLRRVTPLLSQRIGSFISVVTA